MGCLLEERRLASSVEYLVAGRVLNWREDVIIKWFEETFCKGQVRKIERSEEKVFEIRNEKARLEIVCYKMYRGCQAYLRLYGVNEAVDCKITCYPFNRTSEGYKLARELARTLAEACVSPEYGLPSWGAPLEG